MTLTAISPTFSNYSSDESGAASYNPSGGGGQSSDEGGSYLLRPVANAFSQALDGVDLPANPASGGLDESGQSVLDLAALQALPSPEEVAAAARLAAVRGGPTASANELANVDFLLNSDVYKSLIEQFGQGPVALANNAAAYVQLRKLGQERFDQLARVEQALARVQGDYANARDRAAADSSHTAPGWSQVEVKRAVGGVTNESGGWDIKPDYFVEIATQFNVTAFSQWYNTQQQPSNSAFAKLYGNEYLQKVSEISTEFGSSVDVFESRFDVQLGTSTQSLALKNGRMEQTDFYRFDLNNAPDLNDSEQVGWHPLIGFNTHNSNVHEDSDWMDDAFKVVAIIVIAYLSFVTAGAASAAAGGGFFGAVAGGAAAGAVSAAGSGAVNGNLSVEGVARGAFFGAIGGALTFGAGELAQGLSSDSSTINAVTFTGRTVAGGLVAEAAGGDFKNGAIGAFAAQLGQALGAELGNSINNGAQGSISESGARFIGGVAGAGIGSVIVNARGGDGDRAFLEAIVNSAASSFGQAPANQTTLSPPSIDKPPSSNFGTVFDDDGNLMPGVVDTSKPIVDQIAALQTQLQNQGLSSQESFLLAMDSLWQETSQPLGSPSLESQGWSPQQLQTRINEVQAAIDSDLRVQQARADSLLKPEDLLVEAGGRDTPSRPVVPVLNRGFDGAMNAAADIVGVFAPINELRADLNKLQALQAENRISAVRQLMRDAGMPSVSNDYQSALVEGGRMVRDYPATLDSLNKSYEDFIRDRRLTANWGEGHQNLRIGNSKMTVQEFETRTLRLQQQSTDEAYDRGKAAIATGQLPLRNGDYALTLGAYVDEQVRRDLRLFGRDEGLSDSRTSNAFAVNRTIRSGELIGIPDLRLGTGLLSDVSLASKDGYTEQLRRWNYMMPNDTLIVRPTQLGGAYVVPRSTVLPLPSGSRRP